MPLLLATINHATKAMLRPVYLITAQLALLLAVPSHAQLLNVKNDNGDIVNSTQISMAVDSLDGVMLLDLPTVLNGDVLKNVKMRRYELSAPDSSYNYFCWGDCWLASIAHSHMIWSSIGGIDMTPGVPYHGFHAYHEPRGHAGTACFRFVWYDQANVNDTVWVDICFAAEEVGIAEQAITHERMDVYPTPSASDVTFTFEGTSVGARRELVLRDALGQRVRSIRLADGQRTMELTDSELGTGVWFATLERDGVAVTTRRFVITGH